MTKSRGRLISEKAISELERISRFLDAEFDITAKMTMAEVDEELSQMGIDPHQFVPLSLNQMRLEKQEQKAPAYVYVCDELLEDEPATDEVRLLILKLRDLTRQHRYTEALKLAERATALAPDYWRALTSYGSLLLLLGNLDKGEAIFRSMRRDFLDNPKAMAAALHGCACVAEFRGNLNLSRCDLLDVTHLYEEALRLDDSRANTRACFVINSFLSGQSDKAKEFFEASIKYVGFFDAMLLELEQRGSRKYAARLYNVTQSFPMWFRDLLYPGPNHVELTGDVA